MVNTLNKMRQALAEGYHLLIQSKVLACLTVTVITLSFMYLPVASDKNLQKGTWWLISVMLTSFLFVLIVQPFLKAAFIGSYGQLLQKSDITLKEFFIYGRRFYLSVLMLTLLIMLMGMVVTLVTGWVGFLISLILSWAPERIDLKNHTGLMHLAYLLMIPLYELAPIIIVLKRLSPWQAMKESYCIIGQHPLLVPLIVLFWSIPDLLSWVIWGAPSIETPNTFSRVLISFPFLVVATPTMINYLAGRIGPLESLDAPVPKMKIGRPLAIAGGVMLVLPLIGIMVSVYLQFFPPKSMARPTALDPPGVIAGDGLLSKNLIFENATVGAVTDIHVSSGTTATEYRLAGSKGSVVVDAQFHVTSAITFDRKAVDVHPIDVNQDGLFEYMDRGGHGWQNAALFDQNGKVLWRYRGWFGINDMVAGDLDGDGEPEFVVGSNGGGGVRLLNKAGKVEWQKDDGNVWHVEIIDTSGDGIPEIVHSNALGQITIRDRQGGVISRVKPQYQDLYFSNFSIARWPNKKGQNYLLVPGEGKAWLLDFQGNQFEELRMPNSDGHGEITGLRVEFGDDRTDYLAVLVNYSQHDRAVLYLYDTSMQLSKLIYQEILPESASSLATNVLDQSGGETLLVGGNGKVWRYNLK